MKYKVGDKVRIINNDSNIFRIGEIAEITEIDENRNYKFCCENKFNCEWLDESEIELFNYTWEDFLKAPIGTKVTFESGEVYVKDTKESFNFDRDFLYYDEVEKFVSNDFGKIIKIEEPTYITVYEPQEVTMPEIEEMKRLTDELCKTCDEFIKKIKEK